MVNYAGDGVYDKGQATSHSRRQLPDDTFALQGPWTLDYQGATAESDASSIKLNYHAKNVYIVVGGTGTMTVMRDGKTTTVADQWAANLTPDRRWQRGGRGLLDVRLSKGLQGFPSHRLMRSRHYGVMTCDGSGRSSGGAWL